MPRPGLLLVRGVVLGGRHRGRRDVAGGEAAAVAQVHELRRRGRAPAQGARRLEHGGGHRRPRRGHPVLPQLRPAGEAVDAEVFFFSVMAKRSGDPASLLTASDRSL